MAVVVVAAVVVDQIEAFAEVAEEIAAVDRPEAVEEAADLVARTAAFAAVVALLVQLAVVEEAEIVAAADRIGVAEVPANCRSGRWQEIEDFRFD